jgi:HK97 family phage portal protein
MSVITKTIRNVLPGGGFLPIAITPTMNGRPQTADGDYETLAREGYSRNEIVYACIEELSTSAAEPRMHAQVRRVAGEPEGELALKWTLDHRILDLFRTPNPFMDGFEFWATVILHRSIAGNAFALKVRSAAGRPVQLWLMRPDRVRVVPHRTQYIARYEYLVSPTETVPLAVEDVLHFKTRNPLNEFYGMPPLMAVAGRVDIDNYMRDFVRSYFTNAGVPAGVLAVKNKLPDGFKEDVKRRFRQDYGGPAGWHEMLVIDQTEASFTPMTTSLGPQGLVVPSLDEISEARIAMAFGVPLTIIGARLGVNSSSYANKRSDRESFWDEHLAPLYKELAGPLNLRLIPDFPGVKEIAFDLSDVRALQEDLDKIHARLRADLISGGITIEEFRRAIGVDEKVTTGTFLLPSNLVPVPAGQIADESVDLSSVRTDAEEDDEEEETTDEGDDEAEVE